MEIGIHGKFQTRNDSLTICKCHSPMAKGMTIAGNSGVCFYSWKCCIFGARSAGTSSEAQQLRDLTSHKELWPGKGTGTVIPITQTQLWEWEGNRESSHEKIDAGNFF